MRWALASFVTLLFVGLLVFSVSVPVASAGWAEENRLVSVSFYDNTTQLCSFSADGQTKLLTKNEEVSQIRVVAVTGPYPEVFCGVVNLSITSPAGAVVYTESINGAEYNVTISSVFVDTIEYYEMTAFFNLTWQNETGVWFGENLTLEQYGDYLVHVDLVLATFTYSYLWWSFEDWESWDDSIFRQNLLGSIGEDSSGGGVALISLIWVFIVFLPALVMNLMFGKIGFIAGLIIMSVSLMLVGTMPIWVFMTVMIGVVVLVFRGGE